MFIPFILLPVVSNLFSVLLPHIIAIHFSGLSSFQHTAIIAWIAINSLHGNYAHTHNIPNIKSTNYQSKFKRGDSLPDRIIILAFWFDFNFVFVRLLGCLRAPYAIHHTTVYCFRITCSSVQLHHLTISPFGVCKVFLQ